MSRVRQWLPPPLLLLLLCGCATERTTPWTRVPSGPGSSPEARSRSGIAPQPAPDLPPSPPPRSASPTDSQRLSSVQATNRPFVPTTNLYGAWIPLDAWASHLQWTPPERLLSRTSVVCRLQSPNGTLALQLGSQQAAFEGVNYWLGFAPAAANGRVFVHGLDAVKNLRPFGEAPVLQPLSHPVIVIDPGHGGDNTGARSVYNHAWEKEYTLDWALRLRSLLSTNGWRVILTRTNDVDVALTNRVAIADRARADLFISLHFNSAAPRQDLAGLETFCLTPVGLPSTLTRDFEDEVERAFPNNAFDDQNLRLAFGLHRGLLAATGQNDRGVRRARFMAVLRAQNRPAALLEGGFLSNPDEAQQIAMAAFRQKLAEAVAKALGAPDVASVHGAARQAGGGLSSP